MVGYIFILIPEKKMNASNLDADKVNEKKSKKTGNEKTFSVGLSPTGNLPATHYWCCWWMSDEEQAEARKHFKPSESGNKNESKYYECPPWDAEKVLADLQLKRLELQYGIEEIRTIS